MRTIPAEAALAFSLAIAAATPALAKERTSRAGFDARAEAIGSEVAASAVRRAAAIRECNEKSAPLKEYTWGVQEIEQYRSCMAERGQIE